MSHVNVIRYYIAIVYWILFKGARINFILLEWHNGLLLKVSFRFLVIKIAKDTGQLQDKEKKTITLSCENWRHKLFSYSQEFTFLILLRLWLVHGHFIQLILSAHNSDTNFSTFFYRAKWTATCTVSF